MAINISQIKQKNKKRKVITKPVKYPKTIEMEFYKELTKYKNRFKETLKQVLLPVLQQYLTKRDTRYFRDDLRDDIERAIREVLSRFDYKAEAERIAEGLVKRLDLYNINRLKTSLENAVGVDIQNILLSENLSNFLEIQSKKNAELIKSIPEDAVKDIRRIIYEGYLQGLRHEEIASQIAGYNKSSVFHKIGNRIKTIARTEVAKLNSQLTNERVKRLGIKKAVWQTAGDERVRRCHQVRDGKIFNINKGLYSSCDGKYLLPGQDINCRCVARYIIE